MYVNFIAKRTFCREVLICAFVWALGISTGFYLHSLFPMSIPDRWDISAESGYFLSCVLPVALVVIFCLLDKLYFGRLLLMIKAALFMYCLTVCRNSQASSTYFFVRVFLPQASACVLMIFSLFYLKDITKHKKNIAACSVIAVSLLVSVLDHILFCL